MKGKEGREGVRGREGREGVKGGEEGGSEGRGGAQAWLPVGRIGTNIMLANVWCS